MYTRSMPTIIDQIGHQDVYNLGSSCGLLHDQYSKPAIFLHQFKTDFYQAKYSM